MKVKKENLKKEKVVKKSDDSGALFIPAGVLTGIGVGFITGNLPGGLFLGLGIGFIFFAIIEVFKNLYLDRK